MRVKILCVGATLAGTLLVAAAVQAATPQQLFTGKLESQPDSVVRMKTGANNGFAVRVFGVHDFTVDCGGSDGTIKRATIKGRVPIGNKGRFHGRDDNGETVLNVRGEIDGRKASGTFRFSGTIEDQDGNKQDCDSGRLNWSAKADKAT
jgi:hypothetical protein